MEGFWLLAVAGGPVILGLALAYGTWRWRQRRTSVVRSTPIAEQHEPLPNDAPHVRSDREREAWPPARERWELVDARTAEDSSTPVLPTTPEPPK